MVAEPGNEPIPSHKNFTLEKHPGATKKTATGSRRGSPRIKKRVGDPFPNKGDVTKEGRMVASSGF